MPFKNLLKRVNWHIIGFCICLCACEEKFNVVLLSGTLEGKVVCYDENGRIESDNSGVQIMILGHKNVTEIVSDTEGNFTIVGLETGTYDLKFEKPGYTSIIRRSVQIVGGDNSVSINQAMGKISTSIIGSIKLLETRETSIRLEGDFHFLDLQNRWVLLKFRVFYSHLPDPAPENYQATISLNQDFQGESGIKREFVINLPISEFTSGERIYLRIYGENWRNFSYFDTSDKIMRYPDLGPPSEVIQVNIP